VSEIFSDLELNQARTDTFAMISQTVTDADFELFQRMIEKETGIYLAPAKKTLLIGRLSRRLRDLGLPTLHKYYKRVQADPAEHTHMVDCISTNETQFFREPLHFEFMERQIIPRWKEQADAGERPRRIRVWSAGCSTGEEPYSIAMTLLHHFPPSAGWQVEILATDISTRVLARARAGIWPVEKAAQIPTHYLKSFMLRGTGSQQGKMKAGPEIRDVIRFEYLNLLDQASLPHPAPYDLVLCRNVLIYFQPEKKLQVVRGLLSHLTTDGFLFVGHSESLNHLTDCVRSIVPTVYVQTSAFKGK
jgi:chemotaxis protein methyltransferase CheR